MKVVNRAAADMNPAKRKSPGAGEAALMMALPMLHRGMTGNARERVVKVVVGKSASE